ncbi:MAG: alkaline phosphatase family protein [Anaerolineales bacterium]
MKTILVGFDAFDPLFFERLHNQGKTPNLSAFLEKSGYSSFRVSNPPQSEVSWTSIATGLNPGGHGIFDFVHRNPESYGLFVSLLPTKSSMLGTTFTLPHNAGTIFDAAVKDGYPASSLWWPATFPARLGSPVHTIPGLGTPDIFGQLGVGISYSIEPITDESSLKTRAACLHQQSKDIYAGTLTGPAQQNRPQSGNTILDFQLTIIDQEYGSLAIEKQTLELREGVWSPVIELSFKAGPLVSLKVVTQVILTNIQPEPTLYFLPLQLHPLGSPWPYGTPKGVLSKLWKTQGPFLTLGWPQDTTALEEGFITENQFLSLCAQIFKQRERIFMTMLDSYQEGLLGCVFDSLDRIQHMFWKTRPDIIESWYLKLDELAGRINTLLNTKSDGDHINLIFLSDHGFHNFDYKVNLNHWLINQGYLSLTNNPDTQTLSAVDWGTSRAYAIGLNSIYLNLDGREGQGTVTKLQKEETLESIRNGLLELAGPDGTQIFQRIQTNQEAFQGPLSEHGPDLVLGYAPGYRASADTGLGGWGDKTVEKNSDHWEADHCIDADAVPGVIFHNRGLKGFSKPSYTDIPALTLEKDLPAPPSPDPVLSDEDQEILRERLKGLGYL